MIVILADVVTAIALALAQAQDPAPLDATASLRVEVVGLRNDRGNVAYALFDSAETWRREPLRKGFVAIDDRSCTWVIDGLPPGEYALALYHDRNGNRELDRNPLGVPSEPYGFSNDARARFGPPDYDKARFELDRDPLELRIRVK